MSGDQLKIHYLLISSLLCLTHELSAQECLKNWPETQAKMNAIQGALDCQNSPDLKSCQESLGLTEASMASAAAVGAGHKALAQEKAKMNAQVCDLKTSFYFGWVVPSAAAKNDCALMHSKGQMQLAIQTGQQEIQMQKKSLEEEIEKLDQEVEAFSQQKSPYLSEDEYFNQVRSLEKKTADLPEVRQIEQEIANLESQKQPLSLDRVVQSDRRKEIISQRKLIDQKISELQNKKRNLDSVRALNLQRDQLHQEQEKARSARKFAAKNAESIKLKRESQIQNISSKKVDLTNQLNQLEKMERAYADAGKKVNSATSVVQVKSQLSQIGDYGALSSNHLARLNQAQGIINQHAPPQQLNPRASLLKNGKTAFKMVKYTGGAAIAIAGEAFAATTVDENCQASQMSSVLSQKLESGSCRWDFEMNDKNAGFFFESESDAKELIRQNPALCEFIDKTYKDNFPKAQCQSGQIEIQDVRGFNSIRSEGSSDPFVKNLIVRKGMENFSVELDDQGKVKDIFKIQPSSVSRSKMNMTSSREASLQKASRAKPQVSQEAEIKSLVRMTQHQVLQTSACCSGSLSRPSDRACAEMGTAVQHSIKVAPSSQSSDGVH